MTFAEAVRNARAHLEWTQDRLAKEAGMSVQAIGKIERGEVEPYATTIVKLERALKCKLPGGEYPDKNDTVRQDSRPKQSPDESADYWLSRLTAAVHRLGVREAVRLLEFDIEAAEALERGRTANTREARRA